MRINKWTAVTLLMVILIVGCKPKPKDDLKNERTYRMGFQNSAPNYHDINKVLQTLNMWTSKADAAIISMEVPWDSLYNGVTPQQYVTRNCTELVKYYRGKNLKLWVYIDPCNGLDRSKDATSLAAMGKSIAQAEPQQRFRRFCFVMDSMLQPEHMGVALETNLIRGLSPDSIYQGMKAAVNGAAADIAAYDTKTKLSVSVQVDYAWGWGGTGVYQGVEKDFTDFPFVQELGLSSYPYFVYDKAQDIPFDYYSRIISGHLLPVFVSEGGWSSQTIGTRTQTSQKQADYITKHLELLDNVKAIGVFQLLYCDINLSALPPGFPANIDQFIYIGLTDTSLNAKPGLAIWEAAYQRPLVAGN